MTADAFQLVIVFTIVPVLPFTILEMGNRCGGWGTGATAVLFYAGYPLTFGMLMWLSQSRKRSEGGTWQEHGVETVPAGDA